MVLRVSSISKEDSELNTLTVLSWRSDILQFKCMLLPACTMVKNMTDQETRLKMESAEAGGSSSTSIIISIYHSGAKRGSKQFTFSKNKSYGEIFFAIATTTTTTTTTTAFALLNNY
uniref:Uncharacterized protein n=1 Tax=Glossina austeni TaxID=7395 RepID=A0A1A9UIE6_GLOAU